MLPLNLSFRRLVLKYIPQLLSKDLVKFESLTALRHQIKEDIRTLGWTQDRQDANESSTSEANITIIKNFPANEKNYKRVQSLYIAKRNFALHQGNFQQTPASWNVFLKYTIAGTNYRIVQIQTLPFLWFNRIYYFWTKFWDKISLAILILIAIVLTSFINFPPKIVFTPIDSAQKGVYYEQYVIATDPNLYDNLEFSLSDSGFLLIDSLTGRLYGTPPDTGIDTTIVRVTDSHGLSDDTLMTFTILP